MRCAVKNCQSDATCAFAINVPALHCPIAEHDPIRIIVGLEVCDKCFGETKITDLMSTDIEKIVAISAKGKAPPDFRRAFLTSVNLDDPDYLVLKNNARNQ